MPTLILSPRFSPDSNRLWSAGVQLGWQVERLHSHHTPEHLQGQSLVLYGEGLFVRIIADQLNLALVEASAHWLPTLPSQYLHRAITLTTLGDARQSAFPRFIKPALDKTFSATVYATAEELPQPNTFDELESVLACEPVAWEVEVRCFVLERQVMTASAYRYAHLALDEAITQTPKADLQAALQFAQRVLMDSEVAMPKAFVLDVGRISGRGWAVVEANPAWGSGLYGCDPEKVLQVLEHSLYSLTD